MDKLFTELKANILTNFDLYLQDQLPLESLIDLANQFDLIFKLNDEKYLEEMKNTVFEFYKTEFYNLMEQERNFRMKNDGILLDVDLDVFIGQAKRIGKVRQVVYGNEQCVKFCPVVPNLEENEI